MNIINFIFILYLSPIILIYLFFCFTLPLVKIGEIKQGKGIKFYIVKDLIHSDLIFESYFWNEMFLSKEKYIKIGWGDRKIFLETKRWKDLKLLDLVSAFFGINKTCLRVEFLSQLPLKYTEMEMCENQLKIIKIHVDQSYNKKLINKKPEYYQNGDYYESNLKYNCITNCNNWVNKALLKARITNRIWCPITFWL
jgi:hypothetical protein